MSVRHKVVLVSGAKRWISAAVVKELLKADIEKVYIAARKIASLPDFGDTRAVPLQLDFTDQASIEQAAVKVKDVNILINSAGTLAVRFHRHAARRILAPHITDGMLTGCK